MWPWSKFREYERQIRIAQAKLDVVGMSAEGCYYSGDMLDVYSPALVSVRMLQHKLEACERTLADRGIDIPFPFWQAHDRPKRV